MAKRIVFFNNKGGVGKTTMVYHIAYMMRELGYRVLLADFDPQTNLTAMCLSKERLEEVFLGEANVPTITDMMQPVIEGEGAPEVYLERLNGGLFEPEIAVLLGNLTLSAKEDLLSNRWGECMGQETAHAFKVVSLFHTILRKAEEKMSPDFVLIDVAPNLGAINRSVLISADYVVVPVGADLFSLQGIKNLGQTLKIWREEWEERKNKNKNSKLDLPAGKMQPIGYITMQHNAKEGQPVLAYRRWSNRIPTTYREFVLEQPAGEDTEVSQDIHCLGLVRHYHSLMPMAMEARKPIFALKPADGAIGTHYQATKKVYEEFKGITQKIVSLCV